MRVVFVLLLLLLSCAGETFAQDSFRFPANFGGVPTEYLEGLKVRDTSRRLTDRERHELARLFAKAYVLSVRNHRQDFLLKTSTPIYSLLAANFPEVRKREGERGSIIFLGSVTKFFNSLPEYRGDVLQVLREGRDQRHCH
jgi:hypothetical protein